MKWMKDQLLIANKIARKISLFDALDLAVESRAAVNYETIEN